MLQVLYGFFLFWGGNKTEECCDKFHLEVEKKNELTKNGKWNKKLKEKVKDKKKTF